MMIVVGLCEVFLTINCLLFCFD